jgi:cytochrome c5
VIGPARILAAAGALVVLAGSTLSQAQEPPAGEALFKQKCTTCHPATKPLAAVAKMPARARAARLENFLPSHFAPDAAQRKPIIEYLLAEAARQ